MHAWVSIMCVFCENDNVYLYYYVYVWMQVCVCVCVCVLISLCAWECVYMYMCMCESMCVLCLFTFKCMYIYLRACIGCCVCVYCVYGCVYVCILMFMCGCACMCVHFSDSTGVAFIEDPDPIQIRIRRVPIRQANRKLTNESIQRSVPVCAVQTRRWFGPGTVSFHMSVYFCVVIHLSLLSECLIY